ncbi:kinesin-like protein KIF3B [Tachysurus ichikawai]
MAPLLMDNGIHLLMDKQNQQYLARASYLEIYQEEVRDLLAKDQSRRLELKKRPDTDEEEEEKEGAGGNKNIDDNWWEQQENLEKEKKAIMEDHSLVAEEKEGEEDE